MIDRGITPIGSIGFWFLDGTGGLVNIINFNLLTLIYFKKLRIRIGRLKRTQKTLNIKSQKRVFQKEQVLHNNPKKRVRTFDLFRPHDKSKVNEKTLFDRIVLFCQKKVDKIFNCRFEVIF
jgi:hypothetical protein